MKKFCLLMLVFVLAIAVFAACKDDPSSVDTETGSGTTTEAVEPDTSDSRPDETLTDVPSETTGAESVTDEPTDETTTDYFDATRIEIVEADTSKVVNLTLVDEGYDIYQLPANGNGGWRYGPSYIYHGDGRVDAYFASGGDVQEWDRITHRSSTDNGKTWSAEKIVVYPTPNGMDTNSCCDPGAVYFDGYYYVGYTSTLNKGGYCNNIFVARSKTPDGPFEKWNGSGWGGAPAPVIYFDQAYGYWGIGEPAFVELNGTLYIYYTYTTPMQTYFMLATADATNENWPATIEYHGALMEKKTDSVDVKYVEDWGKFIAVTRANYTGDGEWIAVYESVDGKDFKLVDAVRENTCPGMFALGLSSRPNGRIRMSEDAEFLRIGYAYGQSVWGAWNTRLHAITLTQTDANDLDAERAKDALDVDVTRESELVGWKEWTMVRTEKDCYVMSLETGKMGLNFYFRDRYVNGEVTDSRDDDIRLTDYDESIISFEKARIVAKSVGETYVTVRYKNLAHIFRVKVVATEAEREALLAETTVTPTVSDYTIYMGERSVYRPQLRIRITQGDGIVRELYVNDGPAELTFTGYDESVITVSEKGVVTARSVGTTTVTIGYGSYSVDVTVTVSDDPADALFGLGDVGEANYLSLDFSKEVDRGVLSHFLNTEMTPTDEGDGVRVTVKAATDDPHGTDPSFKVVYQGALDPVMTDDYGAIEIVYRVPTTNSEHTTRMEIYIGTGSVMDAQGGYSVIADLVCDGEYHTLRVPVSHLDYWNGQLNVLRFDFFMEAVPGDAMDIRSISLVA